MIDPKTGKEIPETTPTRTNVGTTRAPDTVSASVTPAEVSIGAEAPKLNTALDINKQVDINRGLGMNEQKAYEEAMKKPTEPKPVTMDELDTGGMVSGAKFEETAPVETKPTETTPSPTVSTTTQTTTPTQTTEQLDTEQINKIFQENQMSEDDKKWWTTNIFNTPEEKRKFMSMTPEERKVYMGNIQAANRLTRDTSLKADYAKTQYDRTVADARAKFEVENAKMKANLDADANNMAVIQGTSGRIQSQNLVNAVKNQLDLNRKVYDQMRGAQDSYLDALADEFEYNQKVASNEYNDKMSSMKSDLLKKIEGLQATGAMNTKSGLIQAQNFIDAAISAGNVALQSYQYKLAVGAERAKVLADTLKEQNKYDENITSQMNDGYLYTAQGTRMTDTQGQFLQKPAGVNGVPLFKEPQKADDGSYFMAYQQPNGEIKTVKLSGLEGSTPADEVMNNYARLFAAGKIDMADLKGLSPAAQQKIISAAGAFMDERVKADVKVIGQTVDQFGNTINQYGTVDEYGNITPLKSGGVSGGGTVSTGGAPSPLGSVQFGEGTTDIRGLASKYPGVAAFKNNNPAGITWNANFDNPKPGSTAQRLIDAGISFSRGTPRAEGGNPYVMFDSIEDGLAAQRIMMEGTYGNATIKDMLKSWVGTTEGDNYAKQVASMGGITDMNQKVSSLSKEQLDALQVAKIKKESGGDKGLYAELVNAGLIEGNTINFAQAKTYTEEEVRSGVAGSKAQDFLSSIEAGTITGSTGKSEKKITALDEVLFNKFLEGKDEKGDSQELARRGYTLEDVNKYAETRPTPTELSDKQFTQYNQVVSRFTANPEVKAFESALSSGGDLIASLNNANGPGDVAAVFQFMKTLDPTSTVREGEFALAAKSAGVWEQFKNIPVNKLEGTILNDEQRKAFGKLAIKFVENKAKIYNTKYDEMKRILTNQGIPESYFPTKMSNYINEYTGEADSITAPSGKTYNLTDF